MNFRIIFLILVLSPHVSSKISEKYVILPTAITSAQLSEILYGDNSEAKKLNEINGILGNEPLGVNKPLYLSINPKYDPDIVESRLIKFFEDANGEQEANTHILFNIPDWNLSAFPNRTNQVVQVIAPTSLMRVSYILYGTTRYYRKIAEWNGLSDANKIFVRQYLYLQKEPIHDLQTGHELYKKWVIEGTHSVASGRTTRHQNPKLALVDPSTPSSLEEFLKLNKNSKGDVESGNTLIESPDPSLAESEPPLATEIVLPEGKFVKPAWVVSFSDEPVEREVQSTPTSVHKQIRKRRVKHHNLLASVGYGSNIMEQRVGNTAVSLEFQTAVVDLFYRYLLSPPHWHMDFNLRSSFTLQQEGTIKLQGSNSTSISDSPTLIDFDVRVGYAFSIVEEPWRFMLMVGARSSNMLGMEPRHGGYEQIAYMQLYPTLRRLFANGDSLQFYMKLLPTSDFNSLSFRNTYSVLGVSWQSFNQLQPVSVGIEYGEAIIPFEGNELSLRRSLITLGIQF